MFAFQESLEVASLQENVDVAKDAMFVFLKKNSFKKLLLTYINSQVADKPEVNIFIAKQAQKRNLCKHYGKFRDDIQLAPGFNCTACVRQQYYGYVNNNLNNI